MQIHLAYGHDGLDIQIPDRNVAKVLTMHEAHPLANHDAALRRLLESPLGGQPLHTLAKGKRNACLVICDITRPVPNGLLLPPILEALEQNGIRREQICILVATGLHRPSTPAERVAITSDAIARTYRIIDHHAREPEEQQYLGTTTRGTPVYIDKTYCAADLKVTVGFIEPHLMAGFSGGRKMVAPGCAGELTIKALHSPQFIEDPRCREGSIDENLLHHELLEISRLAGHDFIVNVTLNVAHEITGVFAGDPVAAHTEGIRHARESIHASLPEPADIVVTTSAGYPLDLTFYQAVKGMTAAMPVVRKGGMLILAAECAEGLGSREFTTMATSFATAQEFIDKIATQPVIIDQWQLEECAKAARHAEIVLVTSDRVRQYKDRLFIRTAATVEEALADGFARYGSDAKVAVIPKGPYTLVDAETRPPGT